ncbi:MAG: hypothetical protein GX348_08210 [Veillonellaceae bacterium]|nr:hypothetical protein [Veillonellaceae bacterium]
MKRITIVFVAIILMVATLGLVGCGTNKEAAKAPPAAAPKNVNQQKSTPVVADKSKYLTVADVENVSGLTGIKLVAKDPNKGAGGDLNFATADEKLFVMFKLSSASAYKTYANSTNMFHSTITGIGEEAFIGPKNSPQYGLLFRKGQHTVELYSYLVPPNGTTLTIDQLKQLGKIVESRL